MATGGFLEAMPEVSRAEVPETIFRQPPDQAVAFALCVIKSKPDDLSIRDYISLLQRCIIKSDRNGASESRFAIDVYLRHRVKQLEKDVEARQHESLELRREIKALKSELEVNKDANSNKKRKSREQDAASCRRSQRHLERNASPNLSDRLGRNGHTPELNPSNSGKFGAILVQNFFRLSSVLKQGSNPAASELEFCLCQAASDLSKTILKAVAGKSEKDTSDAFDIKAFFHAATRMVSLLIVGFGKLRDTANGKSMQGKVVHALVHMFNEVLSTIERLSSQEAKAGIFAEAASSTVEKSSTDTATNKTSIPTRTGMKRNAGLDQIVSFLSNAIDQLNPDLESHHALFEGFAYCVLDKLASRLYITVFGHARGSTIETEIAKSSTDSVIGNDVHTSRTLNEIDTLQAQTKLEAPYHIYLLKRIVAGAPDHIGLSSRITSSKVKRTETKRPRKGALAVTAKERLQRTLVNSIFGKEGVDESDPFLDCLRLPTSDRGSISIPKAKESNAADWFREEVWRLLGWEILSKDGDWR